MVNHSLKCDPPFFQDMKDGKKQFEYRLNDRNFHVDDWLILNEYYPDKKKYSGRQIAVHVRYILKNGLHKFPKDYCIMGIDSLRINNEHYIVQ